MAHTQIVDHIVIRPNSLASASGVIHVDQSHFHCKIGRKGISARKVEGDGKTPAGIWHMAYFLYRADKIVKPVSFLPGFKISKSDSWCDSPQSQSYNKPLAFTDQGSKEALWREDDLYDVVIVLDHNAAPRIKNKGSAVFFHIKNNKTEYTEGCIALDKPSILHLLRICDTRTKIFITL